MSIRFQHALVWLRRDLRLDDNAALANACAQSWHVAATFVVDPVLLRSDRIGAPIVQFFFESLGELRTALQKLGSDLIVLKGDPSDELPGFARKLGVEAVFFNEDYEPFARERDARVVTALQHAGVVSIPSLDHVYFGFDEIVQNSGKPYTIFAPYKRRWRMRIDEDPRPTYPSVGSARKRLLPSEAIGVSFAIPRPEDYGHTSSERYPHGGEFLAKHMLRSFLQERIEGYEARRNFPAIAGTSLLSPHLRAGTLGIRTCVAAARKIGDELGARAWLDQLIWRDFYQQLLRHFPRLEHEPFIAGAKTISWRDDEQGWRAWCAGETGYPIVDAAMRQLNETGWMHNRLRMIAASFLTKDLLIDYRRGENYFERHLVDADLAANNGGWQWSASTGIDAVPYFRVFNPVLQGKRFDADGAFVRRMIPQLARVPKAYIHAPWTMPTPIAEAAGCVIGRDYPAPIVEHALACQRALATFATSLVSAVPTRREVR